MSNVIRKNKLMLAAIFKASYNNSMENHVIGGVLGTAFFINNKTALTANHLINGDSFKPNDGFLFCRFWLLLENGQIVEIKKDYLESFPGVDVTKIYFSSDVYEGELNYKKSIANIDNKFILKGFLASVPSNPSLEVSMGWDENGEIFVDQFNLNSVISEQQGIIESINICDLTTNDIRFNNIKCLKLSCGGNSGLSGSPLMNDNGEIFGVMSFGLPEDTIKKDSLFAVSIDEIEKNSNIKI